MGWVVQIYDSTWGGFRSLTADGDVYGDPEVYDTRDQARVMCAHFKLFNPRREFREVEKPERKRTVTLELTVEPAAGNDSDFWEPNGTLVQYGLADTLLGFEKDGWRITRIQAADE